MTVTPALLESLEARRHKILDAAPAAKVAERHAKGSLTARERLEALFGAGTFIEMGMHARHACRDFGMEAKELPGDGVITGIGCVDGRPVAAFSQDFMVGGGALGQMHAEKIVDVMKHALKVGIPVIAINDSGGARIQEGVESLSGYGQVFFHNVLLSGVVPQISIIAGPCAGGAAYSPALMDIIIMTRKNSSMFICGPDVIKAATGQVTTMAEIGSAEAHARTSGNIHFVAEDDQDALRIVRELLSYLPANNMVDPPHRPTEHLELTRDPEMNALVPADPREPSDVKLVMRRLVDDGRFLEFQADWAGNVVCALARIEGVVVGVVANQPMVKAGTLDIDAADKAARFIRFCNVFSIPLLSMMDVPGFLPGVAQEKGGIIRHGAKMLFAWAASTVPKVTLIMRKAYGGAYLAMCSKDMGADMVFAWPTAEIAVMGAEGAVQVLYKDQLREAGDSKEKKRVLEQEYRERFASPWQAAERNMITEVIEPAQTRSTLALALRNLLTKRDTRPPKKHGNITL